MLRGSKLPNQEIGQLQLQRFLEFVNTYEEKECKYLKELCATIPYLSDMVTEASRQANKNDEILRKKIITRTGSLYLFDFIVRRQRDENMHVPTTFFKGTSSVVTNTPFKAFSKFDGEITSYEDGGFFKAQGTFFHKKNINVFTMDCNYLSCAMNSVNEFDGSIKYHAEKDKPDFDGKITLDPIKGHYYVYERK